MSKPLLFESLWVFCFFLVFSDGVNFVKFNFSLGAGKSLQKHLILNESFHLYVTLGADFLHCVKFFWCVA